MADENIKLGNRISTIFNDVMSICIAGFLIWFVADWTSSKDREIQKLQGKVEQLERVVRTNQERNDKLIVESIEGAIGILSEELYQFHEHEKVKNSEVAVRNVRNIIPPPVSNARKQYGDALKHRVNQVQQYIQKQMPVQKF